MVQLYGELMVDLGRPLDAYAALRRSRELIPRSGALSTMLHHLLEATLALRLQRDPLVAAAALVKVERDPTARRRLRILEQIELWRGLIGLLEDDAARAAVHLRYGVDLMLEWDRLFFLPAAAVYLAEAEWRLGDETAADVAADRALWAPQRQGSNHLLLQALREFPAVVSRRLDAEVGTDSAWHGLGRTLMSDGWLVGAGLLPRAHVREFGAPAILVDGHVVRPKLTRSVEVLAYLAAHAGRATKGELLDELFGGRADDSARSYLRQALNRLRARRCPATRRSRSTATPSPGPTITSRAIRMSCATTFSRRSTCAAARDRQRCSHHWPCLTAASSCPTHARVGLTSAAKSCASSPTTRGSRPRRRHSTSANSSRLRTTSRACCATTPTARAPGACR
jgi:hypothetical protein